MSSTSTYRNYLNESLAYEPEQMSRLEYLKYGSLAIFLLLLIVLYVFEFPYFSNTFGVKKLVVLSLFVGAGLGAVIGYFFRKEAEDLTEQVQLYVFFIILTMIFMPLLGSLSNRLLSFQEVAAEQVEFAEIEPFFTDRFGILKGEKVKPNAFHTFFYRFDALSYIRTKTNIFPDARRGDLININTRKGFWGFDYAVLNK
ncbi:MAG: hypothetical protein AB8G22_16210 [Saprospiraceae bacterium]